MKEISPSTPEEPTHAKPDDVLDPDHIVRNHIGWMLSLAKRTLGGNKDAAEDVVQDAFMSAFRSLGSLENPDNIKPWLRRITINAALMKIRQNKRLAEQSIDEHLPEFDQLDCRLEGRWSFLASAEDVQENQIQLDILNKAFSTIPESYRIVLQLRDIEGYGTAEVASILDISESNVKTRLHRARSALKKILEPLLRGEIK